jgi:hypothetical protein
VTKRPNSRRLPASLALFSLFLVVLAACGGDDEEFTLAANNSGRGPGGGIPGGSSGPDAGDDVTPGDPIPDDGVLFLAGSGDFAVLGNEVTTLFSAGASVATGDLHLSPGRDTLVWSTGTELRLAATDGSAPRTLTAAVEGAPLVHTPRYAPDGSTVFLVAGLPSGGGFSASSIYRVPLDADTAIPDRISASAATCAVFRSISARGPSRVIAVRETCGEPGDAGLFEVLTSTGTATALMSNVPDAQGSITATALSSDRGTLYAWASGSFDTNGDLTADVEATGVYAIDLASGELTTYAVEIEGVVSSIAAGRGGVVLGVESDDGDQDLVAVTLSSGAVSPLTMTGDARSPVTY